MKAASIQVKATEVERDAAVVQKKIAKVKIVELEVLTFIEINKLKTGLFNVSKEVERLKEEKKKLKEELRGPRKRPPRNTSHLSSLRVTWPTSYWGFSSKVSKIARRG